MIEPTPSILSTDFTRLGERAERLSDPPVTPIRFYGNFVPVANV
jgi:hypothetical protein